MDENGRGLKKLAGISEIRCPVHCSSIFVHISPLSIRAANLIFHFRDRYRVRVRYRARKTEKKQKK